MTVYTLESDMPWIELPGGFVLQLEAVSPTTGAAITGVTVSDVAVYGQALALGGVIERKIPKLTSEQVVGD